MMRLTIFILAISVSTITHSDAFKCVDALGKTIYQAKPCDENHQSVQINFKTGGAIDKSEQIKRQAQQLELQKQQELTEQQLQQKQEQFLENAKEETEINQTLIKNNPVQFTAYAIPPYEYDKLKPLVQNFQSRLPEIERMRRLAAQKQLASGRCDRVESSELNVRSTSENLVFLVDCSNGESAYFNETELH